MIESIRSALKSLEIEEYRLTDEKTETTELFFVKKELDMLRTTSTRSFRLTVYRNFEHEGQKCKGESDVTISEGMKEKDILNAVRDA